MSKREKGAPVFGLVERLGRGHLHRLLLRHQLRLCVTEQQRRDGGGERRPETDAGDDPEEGVGGALAEVPRGDAEHEHRSGERGSRDRVAERADQVELVRICAIDVISARCVTGLILYPTGCCIQELAARMK